MDPVLVIGGCGGLGHHIVKRLLEKQDASNITVFDLNIDRNVYPGVKYTRGSLASREDVQKVIENAKPQVIFHTASPFMMEQKNSHDIFEKVNIGGTRILLDTTRDTDHVKAVVYTSSSSVVHNGYTDIVNATEDAPKVYLPEQKEFYTHTKAVAEDMVLAANRKHGYKTTVLRGCTLFGEGDVTTIPKIVDNAKAGRGKLQVGYNENLYDYTYLGNAADAHILAAKALLSPSTPEDGPVDGEVFNITNDEPWPFWAFAHAVSGAAGYPVTSVWVVPPFVFYALAVVLEWVVWLSSFGTRSSQLNRKMVRFFTMTRTFDISKAKKRLGYRPEVSMKDAINRSVAAYLASSENAKKKKKKK
ncbi:C-3 sterol dehydrogenase/C-4 decarboxylase [Arthroderma uncinatum]|uniref:C-3 sterol dehydrogenase/C-4 decarboxylase n=1 Tax=Arthroderma uncinatum TaxID=74035 RepID=UPI00144AD938|nr:C-3 sterol dehydrogenase/C-4 decarboxylase [Arthroderma uncinatum]KAF3481965.1 C-3 sterol dehydrogenase/C-4 decarboxylase [Arthroderma uncinatum]